MPILHLYKVGRSVVLTIPPSIRQELKILCGDAVHLEVRDGVLLIRPMEVRAVAPAPLAATDWHIGRTIQKGDE